MKTPGFVIRLKKSYQYFENELKAAFEEEANEYYRYLKAVGFYAFIEQVITACLMFPRSIQESEQNLDDLSFSITDNFGMGTFHLSDQDTENLARLVRRCGNEVFSFMEGISYYTEEKHWPRHVDRDWPTDVVTVADVRKLSQHTFFIYTTSQDFDQVINLPQNALHQSHLYGKFP